MPEAAKIWFTDPTWIALSTLELFIINKNICWTIEKRNYAIHTQELVKDKINVNTDENKFLKVSKKTEEIIFQ